MSEERHNMVIILRGISERLSLANTIPISLFSDKCGKDKLSYSDVSRFSDLTDLWVIR